MWNQLSYLGPLHNDFYDLLYIYASTSHKTTSSGEGDGAVDCRRALQTQYCNIIIDSFCFVTMYGRFYIPIRDLFDIAVKTFSMVNTSMSVKGNSPQGAT